MDVHPPQFSLLFKEEWEEDRGVLQPWHTHNRSLIGMIIEREENGWQAVEASYRIVAESISSRVPLSTVLRGSNDEDPHPMVYNWSICREWSGIESRKGIDYSLCWKYQFVTPTEEGSHQLVHSHVCSKYLLCIDVCTVMVKMCKNVDFVRRGKESLELEWLLHRIKKRENQNGNYSAMSVVYLVNDSTGWSELRNGIIHNF